MENPKNKRITVQDPNNSWHPKNILHRYKTTGQVPGMHQQVYSDATRNLDQFEMQELRQTAVLQLKERFDELHPKVKQKLGSVEKLLEIKTVEEVNDLLMVSQIDETKNDKTIKESQSKKANEKDKSKDQPQEDE